jgi:hypothetical protein
MSFEAAGRAIDRIAKSYGMADLGAAYRRALAENPNLAREYNKSTSDAPMVVENYRRSASEQAMDLAQADRELNSQRAGSLLNTHAMAAAGSNQMGAPNQVSPERYKEAMRVLMLQFPDLGEAYSSGFVAPDNWALLATLVPGVAGEIKKTRGIDPYNLREGRYASERGGVRKYSADHVRYDPRGNEFRTYSFSR